MLREMSIEVIRKCPNNCVHCSSSSSVNCKEIIPFETFCEVVDGATQLGLETICFSGGEPFLHPKITEMVKYANSKGLNSYIYTSGIFLDKNDMKRDIPESILEDIKEYVTKLIFNVEAADSAAYNSIMGTIGCMEYLKKSIKNATDLKIVCEAHFVPMKLNVAEIEDTIKLCESLGISKISFLRLVPHGRALLNSEKILLDPSEERLLKNQLVSLKSSGNHSIRIGVPLSVDQTGLHCEAACGKLNIKYDGFVYPCEVFKNSKSSQVINEEPESVFNKNIVDIYNNSSYLSSVRSYISTFCASNNCENCAGQYYLHSLGKDFENNGK